MILKGSVPQGFPCRPALRRDSNEKSLWPLSPGGRMQNDDGDKTRAREYHAPTLYDYGSLAELTASGTRPHDESAHPGYCPGGWDCYLLKR